MVAEAGGRIVGAQPMGIFPFSDGGRELKGGLLAGLAVHPDFRRRGICAALVKACEDEAWRQDAWFVTTMPNEKSRPRFHKYSYTDLGRRRLLARLVGARGRWVQAVAKRIPARSGFVVNEINDLPAGVETLAREHEQLFPGLRISRAPEWLRWRFLQAPLRDYRLLEARENSGRLAGMAVATLDEREGARVCYLMDLLAREQQALAPMLGALCELARKEHAEIVATVVSLPSLADALRRAGMWLAPAWLPVKRFYSVARFNPERNAPARWHALGGWHQTLADWDNL
jgi:GNAT superfamily N-acetyltransferase